MLERSRKVVLLVDYDNLQICASRDTPGRDLQLTPVVQLAQKYGTVILARAYAEWNLSTERLAVYKAGIEPAFAPVLRTESDRSGKSLADTVMVAEGMDMLWTLSPDVVVLATSDKDLIPLVRVAKQRGAFVVVLGSDFTAIPLREMADEHITYKQLISDTTGRYTTEAVAARQPAAVSEPTTRGRRATRERNGREPRQAAVASTAAPATPRPEARPDREVTPPAAPATTPEPVAPVTTAAPGESDGQIGGRRRRRRGSRRRAERLGVGGEVSGAGEGGEAALSAEAAAAEAAVPEAAAPEAAAPAPEAPSAPEAVSTDATAAPAPRTRRRRTRAAAPVEAHAEPAAAPEAPAPDATTTPLPQPPAEQPAPESVNGEAAESETPAPRPRARRVASASRGRSRVVR